MDDGRTETDSRIDKRTHPKIRILLAATEIALRTALRELLGGGEIEASVGWSGGNIPEGGGERGTSRYIQRLPIKKSGGLVHYVRVANIDWIEGANQYARVHIARKSFLIRESLTHLELQLDPQRFLRIHRSAIVNLERIVGLHSESPTQRWAILETGERVPVNQVQWEVLQKALRHTG